MINEIVGALKDQVGSSLMDKIGLNQQQSDDSIDAAASSVTDLLGGSGGLDLGDALNLFSADDNSTGAANIMGQLGDSFLGQLTSKVGLDAGKASGVKDILLPMLVSYMSNKVGGDENKLSGLVGGLLSGKDGGASSLLGGVTKLFGK